MHLNNALYLLQQKAIPHLQTKLSAIEMHVIKDLIIITSYVSPANFEAFLHEIKIEVNNSSNWCEFFLIKYPQPIIACYLYFLLLRVRAFKYFSWIHNFLPILSDEQNRWRTNHKKRENIFSEIEFEIDPKSQKIRRDQLKGAAQTCLFILSRFFKQYKICWKRFVSSDYSKSLTWLYNSISIANFI